MTDQHIVFITDNRQLADLCDQIRREADVIALDTEFIRVGTFYPEPALVQLASDERIALIDPLAVQQWQPLADILADPQITKVLHACDEDVELFYHFLHVEPVAVFDTQVAAALCGYDFSMAYQRLIKQLLDIDVDKGHSRSNWLQRPLSDAQIHYAADDVRYLLPVFRQLSAGIDENGRRDWLEEEYQAVLAGVTDTGFVDAWQRIKQSWKLNPLQLARLQALACWREKRMREKNLPRKRIASNDALMTLASRDKWQAGQLFHVEGLPGATAKKESATILALLDAVNQQGGHHLRVEKPGGSDELMKRIRRLLAQEAANAQLAEQMLSKKAYNQVLFEALKASAPSLPASISGWRRPFYQIVWQALSAGNGGGS